MSTQENTTAAEETQAPALTQEGTAVADTAAPAADTAAPAADTAAPAAVETASAPAPEATQEAPATPVIENAAPAVVTAPTPKQAAKPVAAPKAPPAPAAKPATTAPAVVSNSFNAMVEGVKTNGSDFQKNLLTALETYVFEMAPGKRHLNDDAAMKQYTLWVTLRNVINDAPVEEFRNLWSMVLAFFVEYAEKSFHERYVFRFTEHWRWSKQELDGFLSILNLIKLTADPKVRAVGLKRVDLNRALVSPITDDGRNRLLNFYK